MFYFQNTQCHSKQTSDFVFQGGCSSLICTAGHSADGKNVAMWDTLMSQKRCQVRTRLTLTAISIKLIESAILINYHFHNYVTVT